MIDIAKRMKGRAPELREIVEFLVGNDEHGRADGRAR